MSTNSVCDIAIVGAGAAGLAAAIFAAETAPGLRIVVLEGARTVGAKILISGGGRCNVTHDHVRPEDFNGLRPIVRNILAAFDAQATVRWFESLGVPLKREDTGKLFPTSDRARSVLEALLGRCTQLNAAVLTGRRVHAIEPAITGGGFVLQDTHGEVRSACVIMATGGRSLPRTGSDGLGWELVRRLDHTVTETHMALVPLILSPGMHTELSGVSQPVALSVVAEGKRIDTRVGSLLWTHFGVSGPVVMDASRHWVIARAHSAAVELRCSFLPGLRFEDVERQLLDAAKARPRLSVGRALGQQLPDRVADTLVRHAGIDPALPLGQLGRGPRRTLVHTLTDYALPVERARGWDAAEVTAGGVPLAEIDYRTMASRRVPDLYLIGEMLDCDGRIGGFNFQWAWSTGWLAGLAAARSRLATA